MKPREAGVIRASVELAPKVAVSLGDGKPFFLSYKMFNPAKPVAQEISGILEVITI